MIEKIPPQTEDSSDWLMVVDIGHGYGGTLYWWPKEQRGFKYHRDIVIVETDKLYIWAGDEGELNFAIHKDLLR